MKLFGGVFNAIDNLVETEGSLAEANFFMNHGSF